MPLVRMLLPLLLLTSSLPWPTSSYVLVKDLQRRAERAKLRMVDTVLSSLNSATTCLEKEENFFVTDVMCLRILQAYVKGVKRPWSRNPAMKPINKKIKKLSKKLAALLRRSTSFLSEAFADNLDAFNRTVQANFWKVPKPLTSTSNTEITDVETPLETLKGNISEECMINLLQNSGNTKSCMYSDFCRNLMTMNAISLQQRTYQAMYFLFSKMIGCTNGMFANTQEYLNFFCSNLLALNIETEISRYHSSYRDAFLKNIVLCGTSGFVNFYKVHWLVNILQWQDPQSGCFNTAYDSSVYGTTHASAVLGGFLYAREKHPESFVHLTSLVRDRPKLPLP